MPPLHGCAAVLRQQPAAAARKKESTPRQACCCCALPAAGARRRAGTGASRRSAHRPSCRFSVPARRVRRLGHAPCEPAPLGLTSSPSRAPCPPRPCISAGGGQRARTDTTVTPPAPAPPPQRARTRPSGHHRGAPSLRENARLLPPGERQVAVLDHVPDLPLHRHEEEHEPVEEEDRPEDGDVKHLRRNGANGRLGDAAARRWRARSVGRERGGGVEGRGALRLGVWGRCGGRRG